MYTKYFGLDEKPFSITPDPHFLFLSERHTEALAHLVYGVTESGGFIQLTGEVGTGKTTLTRCLLDRLPESVDLAVVLNPRLTVQEFLFTIFDELQLPSPDKAASNKELVDALNQHLLDSHARGRRTVLLVDEAQNLDSEVLEQLRLLTNLETSKEKLLQIMLVGQPELRNTLARNDLRQLAQRITGRYHLENLTGEETIAYVQHRMKVAGSTEQVFTNKALWEVHRLTQGSPRLTNIICDRSLLGAYSSESSVVTPKMVRDAAAEVQGVARAIPAKEKSQNFLRKLLPLGALAVALAFGMAIPQFFNSAEISQNTEASVATEHSSSAESSIRQSDRSLRLSRSLIKSPTAPSKASTISLGTVLSNASVDTSTDKAFEHLFAMWQLPAEFGQEAPCSWALKQDLKCEFLVGSIRVISSINRPAILSLVDESGQNHNALLEAVGTDTLTMRIDDQKIIIPKQQLAQYWFGEFLVVWRPHPGADSLMLPGTRSEGIAWLRSVLAAINGQQQPAVNSTFFDQALADQVAEFQRSQRLEPDGKVGVQTLIAINSVQGSNQTPMLSKGL